MGLSARGPPSRLSGVLCRAVSSSCSTLPRENVNISEAPLLGAQDHPCLFRSPGFSCYYTRKQSTVSQSVF